MARSIKDPIPVEPFLAWCREREAQIVRELDYYPGIAGRLPNGIAPRTRLVMELGWSVDDGIRRLYRWEHEIDSDAVERATVEDALDCAGVDFHDVYVDVPRAKGHVDRLGQGRLMTDAQIAAANTVYWKAGLSTRVLADLLWEQYGYANADSCATQLRRGFANLGLKVRPQDEANLMAHLTHGLTRNGARPDKYKRFLNLQRHGQCEETLRSGEACPRAAKAGTTRCGYHQPEEIERRRAQIAAVNAQGKNVLRWANRDGVAA